MEKDCECFGGKFPSLLNWKNRTSHIPSSIENISFQKPSEAINFNCLYMVPVIRGVKHVLVIKDDLSSYTWLTPHEEANAKNE